MSSPPLIGLTGGIGSGKSTVAGILSSLGCIVSDADELAREELGSSEVIEEMRDHWGEGVFDKNGEPNRGAIAAVIFEDDMERGWLERIIHPRVVERRKEFFASAPADAPAYVIDAPLLVETGMAEECDLLIFVETPRENRIQRVAQSRDWNNEEFERREGAQADPGKKRGVADFVIDNDCDLKELRSRVEDVLTAIQGAS
jgi:dephospho-CoA kinase